MKTCLIAVMGGLVTINAATAQVVTPPTAAPTKTPEYVPPPQPPAQPQVKPSAARPKPLPPKVQIPAVDYKPVFEKGADGKVLPLSDMPQRLSLVEVHNPFVKDEDRAKFADYLAKRDRRMEQVAVDNLDLVEKVEGGEIDRLNFVDPGTQRQSFTNARAMTDPINPFGDLISDMVRRELLTDLQAAFSDKLCKEYRTALREENRPANGGRVDATWMARYTYNNKAEEAIIAANRVRALAVSVAGTALPNSGIESAVVNTLTSACKNAPSDDKGRAELFNKLGKDLSIEQRRAWMRAALATLPPLEGEVLMPFPKVTARHPAGEEPNAEPGAEQPGEQGGAPGTETGEPATQPK